MKETAERDEFGVEVEGSFNTPRHNQVPFSTMSNNKPQSKLFKRRSSSLMPPPRPLRVFNSQPFNKFQIGSTLFKPLDSPAKQNEVKKCLFEGAHKENNDPGNSILGQPLNSALPCTGATPAQVRCNFPNAVEEASLSNKYQRRSLLGKRANTAFKFPKPNTPVLKPPARPLFSSSPNTDDQSANNTKERHGHTSDSIDSSHPFGNFRPSYGDETFMTRDVCELNTWSVFKSKNPDARRSAFMSPQSMPLMESTQEVEANYLSTVNVEKHNEKPPAVESPPRRQNPVTISRETNYTSRAKIESAIENPSDCETPLTRPSTLTSLSNVVNLWASSKVNPYELRRPLWPSSTRTPSESKAANLHNNPFLPLPNSLKKTTPVKSPTPKKQSPANNNFDALTQAMVNERALNLLGVSPPHLDDVMSDHDSTSSFIINESTINTGGNDNTLTAPTTVSKVPPLEVIHEGHSNDLINFSQREEDLAAECDEARLGEDQDEEEGTTPIGRVIDLMTELSDLRGQMEALNRNYNRKWEELNECVQGLASSHHHQVQDLSKALTSIKLGHTSARTSSKKKRGVVSTKVKKIQRRLMSPTGFTPTQGGSKMKAASVYTRLRASYSVLRTPEESVVKKKQVRKSACYTPHSLTMCVEGQLNDIFGSN